MPTINELIAKANEVYRDRIVANEDTSQANRWKPPKPDVRNLFALLAEVLQTLQNSVASGFDVRKDTRALLFADLAHGIGTIATVTSDPTPAFNGFYYKNGASGAGSWTKIDLPFVTTIDGLRSIGPTLASAATVNIGASTGDYLNLTGVTPIQSFGSAAPGVERTFLSVNGFVITHNPVSMINPNGADLVLVAGDVATYRSMGSGNWRFVCGISDLARAIPSYHDQIGVDVGRFGERIDPPIVVTADGGEEHPLFHLVPGFRDKPGTNVDKHGAVIDPEVPSSSEAGDKFGYTEAMKRAQEANAAAYSAAVRARPVPMICRMFFMNNVFLDFGQSLAQGGVAHPLKTVAVPAWNISAKMAGSSVRPTREDNTWFPFGFIGTPSTGGTFTLQSLVATMDIDNAASGNRYDPATFVTDVTGGINGEAMVVGMTYEFALLHNEHRSDLSGNFMAKSFIASVNGFGGQQLESLISVANMPGTTFSARLRTESYFDQLEAHVNGTLGQTLGYVAVHLDQGQGNFGATTESQYYTSLDNWKAWNTTLAQGLPNQTVAGHFYPPIIMIDQTADHWVEDDLDVPNAQLKWSLANEDAFLVAPNYATPGKMEIPVAGLPAWPADQNDHKDGNATRWKGAYAAKVLKQVLVDNEYWEPTHLADGSWHGNQAMLSWHMPVPPVRVIPCYRGYRLATLADLGITFTVDGVAAGFVAYEVYGRHSIMFTLDRTPADGAVVRVLLGAGEGKTNISDSDPSVSRFNYEPHHQDYAARDPNIGNITPQEQSILTDVDANLGALYNKPYPLPNRACLETFTLTRI